jgi:ParB family chromosome partitioning protein
MATERTPRRLGRGLDALLGAATRGERDAESSPFRKLAVSEIRPNPLQPRRDFGEEELRELRDSMQANGLLQPVTVRPDPAGDGYQLIAGERRWRAAQSLGWTEIAAAVREVDDRTLLALALVENLQRADLNPLEEALGYRRLATEFGLTQQSVAQLVGKSRSTVANLLRLLGLPEPVQAMLRSGELTAGQVRPLLALNDPAAITALADEVRARKLPARAVEKRTARKTTRGQRTQRPHRDSPDANARALEDDLRRHLQTDVKLSGRRGGGGDITIRFYSADDLDRLLERLGMRRDM